jgi:DHA1 family multidrug resistance protein-like MFS transporter
MGSGAGFILIASLLAASAAMLFVFVKKEPVRIKSEQFSGFKTLKKVFRIREIRLMFPIWLIIATLLGIAITYLPRIMMSRDISGTTIGIMFGLAGIALGLLQPFWGKVSDIVGRIPVMAYGVFSIFGIVVMMLFFSEYAFEVTDQGIDFKLLGMIPLAILGLGAGAFVPAALALMADSSSEESYGATMGLYSFALGFGAFLAEGLGLLIILANKSQPDRADTAPMWLLYFAAVLIVLAVVMMVLFFVSNMFKNRRDKMQAEKS